MNNAVPRLSPPHPFRQRVLDPNFYLENMPMFSSHIDNILALAQSKDDGRSGAAVAWAEQIVILQKSGKLPPVEDDLVSAAQVGIAVADYEKSQPNYGEGQTTAEIHGCLAILAMDDNRYLSILRSFTLDGAYYLTRMSLEAEFLGKSVLKSF